MSRTLEQEIREREKEKKKQRKEKKLRKQSHYLSATDESKMCIKYREVKSLLEQLGARYIDGGETDAGLKRRLELLETDKLKIEEKAEKADIQLW